MVHRIYTVLSINEISARLLTLTLNLTPDPNPRFPTLWVMRHVRDLSIVQTNNTHSCVLSVQSFHLPCSHLDCAVMCEYLADF